MPTRLFPACGFLLIVAATAGADEPKVPDDWAYKPVVKRDMPKVAGKTITTIEGLAPNGVLNKVQQAWLDHDVPQCGYCQCGMIMAVAALLKDKPKPTDADIDANITNICRCGTFQQVRAAIHAAAASA